MAAESYGVRAALTVAGAAARNVEYLEEQPVRDFCIAPSPKTSCGKFAGIDIDFSRSEAGRKEIFLGATSGCSVVRSQGRG